MKNCTISRFDAHKGVVNATIEDTTLGRNFNAVGGGTMNVRRVTRKGKVEGSNFIWLRSDYESYRDGEINFEDCTMDMMSNNRINSFSLIDG